MKKTREFKGMPILTLQEGERLGQVRELILDPSARQVVALVLDRRVAKGEDQVIATANVRNVGTAAITVEDRSSMVPLSRIPRFQELARSQKPIQGKIVISETGVRLGQVDDLEIDVQTFRIVSLVLKGTFGRGRVLSAELVRTIGNDAIVVREEAAPAATPPLAPATIDMTPRPTIEPAPPPPPSSSPEEVLSPFQPAVEPMPAEPAPLPPSGAEPSPPDPGASPDEAAPPEPAENSWQRWVRRLKNG